MLDGLTKSKFYTKCKSLTKMTKTRVDGLKKKKSSVVKFLKNDMAELLRTGLDYNAYCRAEGLLVEQNLISCFVFIEQFCGCILTNLSVMSKQKECPMECREAVQSLCFSAARFAEIPELRELRNLFSDRYGISPESYVRKEFIETTRPESATKEMKLQLMHDIAKEFCIEWSSKALEQKLFKPPSPQQDQQWHESLDNTHGDSVTGRGSGQDDDVRKRKGEKDNAGATKRDSYDSVKKVDDMRDPTVLKRNEREHACHGRKNSIDDGYRLLGSSSEDETVSTSRRYSTSSDQDSIRACSSSVGSASDDEVENKLPLSYRFVLPSYFKAKVGEEERKTEEPPKSHGNAAEVTSHQGNNPVGETKPKARSVRTRLPGHGNASNVIERPLKPPPGHEPVSSFDRPLKLPPGREKVGCSAENDGSARTNTGALKQREAMQGLMRFFKADDDTDDDDEEKMIDELLKHYSKKKSLFEPISKEKATHLKQPHPPRQKSDGILETNRHKRIESELPLPVAGRAASGSARPTEQAAAAKRHGRSVSLQPDMLSTGNVHRTLPADYDELAARIAAFRGR